MTSEFNIDRLAMSYHLYVNEPEDTPYYFDKYCIEQAGNLNDLNRKIIKVVTQNVIQNEHVVLCEQGGQLLGWFKPTHSLIMYRKAFESVIIDFEKLEQVKASELIPKIEDIKLVFNNYDLTSKYYVFDNEIRLEALYSGPYFLGFIPSKVLLRHIKIPKVKSQLLETIHDVYTSPKQNRQFVSFSFDTNNEVIVEEAYPALNMVRISQHKYSGWVDQSILAPISFPLDETVLSVDDIKRDHLVRTLVGERKKEEAIIKKLLNENISLRQRLVRAEQKKNRINELYNNLKNSKLGRLQVAFWEKKSGGRKK
ncbi:hypothetical protein [Macrococcus lamae]|uniref:Uncharacterized protein n=1 Tax=Macrococcus lamae TaxID=198484 RepID=A0A4R6BW37_9STAP|nr:hypothetical protein [Macrococcus lamae]TDM12397.1 hypothetical protein ERX29_03475 [Macrococcus lamae]